MDRIDDTVHRDNVRIVRQLRRFRNALACGQLGDAIELFGGVRAHTIQSLDREEIWVDRTARSCDTEEVLRLLERDAIDHASMRKLLDDVQSLLQRSLAGEMGLDQPLLELIKALEAQLVVHAAEEEEPLCSMLDRVLSPDVARELAGHVAGSSGAPDPGRPRD